MSFGVQIFNTKGQDMVSGLVAEFTVDTIIPSGNGSQSYTLGPGEQLHATRFITFQANTGTYSTILDSVSISGNTVHWSTRKDPYLNNPYSDAILVTKVTT